jgi:hypothetical protein
MVPAMTGPTPNTSVRVVPETLTATWWAQLGSNQ